MLEPQAEDSFYPLFIPQGKGVVVAQLARFLFPRSSLRSAPIRLHAE